MVTTILLNERIDDQTAIETTKDDRTRRYDWLTFLNHQAFTFSTGHGVPPTKINDGTDVTS